MKTFLLTSALILVLIQSFESAPAYAGMPDRKYMGGGYGYGEEYQRNYNGYEGGYDNDDDEYSGNEYESSSRSYGKGAKLADVVEVNVIVKSLDHGSYNKGYERKNSLSTDNDGYSRSIGYAPQRRTYVDENTYGSRSYDDDNDSYKISPYSYGGVKDSYNYDNDNEDEDEYEGDEDKEVYGSSKYGGQKYASRKSKYNDRRSYKMKKSRNAYGKKSSYPKNKYY